jgi:hypothetical protein
MRKKSSFPSLLVLCALLGGCRPIEQAAAPTRAQNPQSSCGDGQCVAPENAKKCPQDCAAQTAPAGPKPEATVENPEETAPQPPAGEAVLYIGLMVHLEQWDDAGSQSEFDRHAAYMRQFAGQFETYGGKLTWESKQVTEGVIQWGDNVLLEMQQRGHGVGVHADIGGQSNYDCSRFTDDLRAEKQQLESLQVTVRHVSGIVSRCDWVTAAVEAGFLFTTGQVAYSVMSMPEQDRPPEYRNCATPSDCHQIFPEELADRIYPWRMHSGADWLTHDPDGKLVMLAASQGIMCMDETRSGKEGTKCEHTLADNEAFLQYIDEALALSDPHQVNIYYAWWSLGDPLDTAVLEDMFAKLKPYTDSGRVQWKTLPEMYDAYVAWENNT